MQPVSTPFTRPAGWPSRRARSIARTLQIGLLTLVLGGSARLSLLLPSPFAALGRRYRRWVFRSWSRACLHVAGIRVTRHGQPPAPPFFLVANHLGYLDLFVLGAALDNPVFVAQHEVAGWPMVGMLARVVDTIFVNRGDPQDLLRVNRAVEAALDAGRSVVMFPEGTSTPGLRVEPFMSPVLEPPARRGMPVHAASLHYRTPSDEVPAQWSVCWWGPMTFAPHAFQLLQMSGVEATVTFAAEPVQDANRKQLARRLWSVVDEAFTPVVTGEEACRIPWP